ncbi:MAG: outer membrane lipoprotein-sorting protein [Candidatus Competibacteraceae bacterium]|nr:outer membrane lipoprotein-sorting protein [Candidatus Competibacteraceae bacterium]
MRYVVALLLLLTVGVLGLPLPSWADDVSPAEILKQSDAARGGGLPGIKWAIKLTAVDDGETQKQELTVQARDNDSLVEFKQPPKIKGQKLLTVERNMWFIKPGLRKAVPISARQRLLGQASNGDVAATNYAGDYQAVLLGEEMVNGDNCYRLELTARENQVTYDRILYWVSKSRHVGVQAEFYTVSGKLFKRATFEYGNQIDYQGQHIPFVSKMIIIDEINKNNKTTLEYSNIQVVALPDRIFNLQLLTH